MDKYEKALEAINEVYSDKSVSAEETIDSLNGLKDEIDVFIDALEMSME